MGKEKLAVDQLAEKTRRQLPDISDLAIEGHADDFISGNGPGWRNRGDLTPYDKVSSTVRRIFNHLHVFHCAGRGLDRQDFPLYVEILFSQEKNRTAIQNAAAMFDGLGMRDKVLDDLVKDLKKRSKLPYVYTAADLAHPFGHFWRQLVERPIRPKAFLVTLLGLPNPLMCTNCIRSFVSNKTWNNEYFLWPFHCCISAKDKMGNCCSNCVWLGYKDCEWSTLPGYLAVRVVEGYLDWLLRGSAMFERDANGRPVGNPIPDPRGWHEDRLNPWSAPRITSVWPVTRELGETEEDFMKREESAKAIFKQRLKEVTDRGIPLGKEWIVD